MHAAIDLQSGAFEIRSAGHPPAVQMLAAARSWAVHEAEGPVLGLMSDPEFTVITGSLEPGDALLLFTDGLVETPQRDVSIGVDKLLSQGELLRETCEDGARKIIDRLESYDDDRALLLLHRR